MKKVNTIEQLLSHLGIEPGGTIEFTGSQHYRDWELEIDFIPKNEAELKALIATASKEDLLKMGVCVWETYRGQLLEQKNLKRRGIKEIIPDGFKPLQIGEIHYLFPAEWYDYIPEGFPIVDIMGVRENFKKGETDNDMRFGCLCFGFIRSF